MGTQQDFELTDPPTDSISSLTFSSQADHLAVGSWDNSVRIYEIASGQDRRIYSQGRAMYNHGGPVLSVCWNQDGTQIISGSTDNTARIYDIASGRSNQIAQHDAPVKAVKFFMHPQSHTGILATGSWDKTLKYWDMRSPTGTPIYSVSLPDKIYDFDVLYPYLVVGTAQLSNTSTSPTIHVYHLDNPTIPYKSIASPLKKQIRALNSARVGDENRGFVIGGVEGRVAVQYIEDQDASKSYSFKCHRQDIVPNSRDQGLVYALNNFAFHPVSKALATCGSDGSYHFWNLESRTRIKTFSTASLPTNPSITTTTFNATGAIFAYAVSYDWHKGHIGMTPGYRNGVFLKAVKEEEVGVKSRSSGQ
ncbi:Poly(A)+ RNA export protein [Dendrothele bispora CBS 962.96]|uniref:Poly(A)+ RNA export protein n=1 Tax=Dendrothele bispora (strain CBS 962.96) TaxID=1314807 RepID=A0A4S8LK63_DENBC|nr:Poly(A)+ RNA export protein [Dendrothele bispora CBS 962.96]